MATTPNVNPDINNEFDMPDEFNVPTLEPSPHDVYNPPHSEGGALTLEDLEEIGVNEQQDEAERKKLYPPPGDWIKSIDWDYRLARFEGDCQPGDISPSGRTIYVFFGKPEERIDREGNAYQPVLNLRMSPDRRFKQDDPTKVDFSYAMYLKAKDLYLALKGAKMTKQVQLVRMLIEDEYVVRTMNGDSGPFVLEVKQRRQQKK